MHVARKKPKRLVPRGPAVRKKYSQHANVLHAGASLTGQPRGAETFGFPWAGLWVLLTQLLIPLTACSGQSKNSTTAGTDLEGERPAAVTSLSTAQRSTDGPGEDWPAFLGPRGDGTSAETGIDPARWNPHPPLQWILSLGVGYSAPAIADGRLYQFDRFDDQERLTCFDALTAKEIWRWESPVVYEDSFGYNNGPRCSPIVAEDRVYTYGVAGRLSCLEASTGNLLWTKDLVEQYSVVPNFFGVASTPILHEDTLWVMVGGSPPTSQNLPVQALDQVEPNGSAIVGFDKETGAERYRLGDDLASYASLAIRTIDGKPTGLAFLRSGLLAWDPRQGKELYSFPWRASMLESVNAAVPVTSGDQIFLSETYEVGSVLLQIEQGHPKVLWQDTGTRASQLAFRAHWSTPVLIDGYLYGCSGRNQPDSDFRCIRFRDGAVQWRDRRHERSSVLAIDGYLIVLGESGRLELVKPTPEQLDVVAEVDLSELAGPQGQPLLSYPCWSAPIVSHGMLYLRGRQHLLCFDLIPAN